MKPAAGQLSLLEGVGWEKYLIINVMLLNVDLMILTVVITLYLLIKKIYPPPKPN